MRIQKTKAFTIIELLVVVSIIALLIGILLPAIGKARDHAYVTRSQANLRQLATAHATYASEWNDNQWTLAPHNLASYGSGKFVTVASHVLGYVQSFQTPPKSLPMQDGRAAVRLGVSNDPATGMSKQFLYSHPVGHSVVVPIDFQDQQGDLNKFGSFQLINSRSFNTYLGGRFYDATFFAPKDRAVIGAIGECYEAPGEYCVKPDGDGPYFSSYILSPAAMFAPELFQKTTFTKADWISSPGVLRSPSYSQARYPDLKTHMLEHHWLQRPKRECRAGELIAVKTYAGCQPYFFNGAEESAPVTLFYDGHVGMLGVREARQAHALAVQQKGGLGLWHKGTAWGNSGYWHDAVYQPPFEKFGDTKSIANPTSSYHILTRDGILGRDTFSR